MTLPAAPTTGSVGAAQVDAEQVDVEQTDATDVVDAEVRVEDLVEDVSIDGMCGVY